MAAVDAGYASWLKVEARYVTSVVAGAAAAWGDKAVDSTAVSPLALHDDAQAEASRQALFLAGPLAQDKHVVKGLRSDLIGKPITLQNAKLGYGAGITAFVIGAEEVDGQNLTNLTVLRRL